MSHDLHCYDYVNQPYEIVRRAVVADPQALFGLATTAGVHSRLHVRLGAVDVAAKIEIEIVAVEEKREALERPATVISIQWQSRRRSSLFPTMTGTFMLYPLSPTETQVELSGRYETPLGALGDAIDAVALHGFAQESVGAFVREVATHLRRTLSVEQASA
ncbi:MAG: hypothetical protein H0V17_21575 [Deltaproteobacteria bacterium]|nr:hypothetical protein [Deltaproteobacteria bacterium]